MIEVPVNRASVFLVLLCVFSVVGVIYAQRLPTQRVEALPHAELVVGARVLSVPVARTPEQRSAGLRGSSSPILLFAWPKPTMAEFNMLGCDRALWRFDLADSARLGAPTVMRPGTQRYPVSSPVRCVLEVDPSSAVAVYFKPGASLRLPSFCS